MLQPTASLGPDVKKKIIFGERRPYISASRHARKNRHQILHDLLRIRSEPRKILLAFLVVHDDVILRPAKIEGLLFEVRNLQWLVREPIVGNGAEPVVAVMRHPRRDL